ncbi:MAG: ParA family protein [Phycisphaerales bacterium]
MTTYTTRPTVIAIGNQKGGVGKTTTAINLAAALGVRGQRVLIIDLDPAAGATRHLGIDGVEYEGALELLCGDAELEPTAITDGMPPGVALIPARHDLSTLHRRIARFADPASLLCPVVEQALRYDFILLDTSPHPADTTTLVAYGSAEWFLLTVLPHHLSLLGLTEACRDISEVRKRRNPGLEILGVLLCCVDERATRTRSEITQAIDASLPGRRFVTRISQATAVHECAMIGRPLLTHPVHRHHNAARQFLRLAVEVERRVHHGEAFRDYCCAFGRNELAEYDFESYLSGRDIQPSPRVARAS